MREYFRSKTRSIQHPTLTLSRQGENSPKPDFVLLTPEPRKETAILDHDLALDLDRFPNFSRPGFMGREQPQTSSLSSMVPGSVTAQAPFTVTAARPRLPHPTLAAEYSLSPERERVHPPSRTRDYGGRAGVRADVPPTPNIKEACTFLVKNAIDSTLYPPPG